jgi:lysozyme family protein
MQHPFAALAPEYTSLLARMQITRVGAVEAEAQKLIKLIDAGDYDQACAATGVPKIVASASFEREASSNFRLSPAQGDPWNRISVHVPAGRGPFASWEAAAIDAYKIDHLDAIGAANWSWERSCYEEELFNGFGYRAYGIHSPYLWAGTNNYVSGKYVADGRFDPSAVDSQIGVIAMMSAIVALRPDLALPIALPAAAAAATTAPPAPQPAPTGLRDAAALQRALNQLGVDPQLAVDDNYGRETRLSVEAFQQACGLQVDGIAGPETWLAINNKLKAAS